MEKTMDLNKFGVYNQALVLNSFRSFHHIWYKQKKKKKFFSETAILFWMLEKIKKKIRMKLTSTITTIYLWFLLCLCEWYKWRIIEFESKNISKVLGLCRLLRNNITLFLQLLIFCETVMYVDSIHSNIKYINLFSVILSSTYFFSILLVLIDIIGDKAFAKQTFLFSLVIAVLYFSKKYFYESFLIIQFPLIF